MSHMSVLGVVGSRPKQKSKAFFGKKECMREATAGRRNNTRACKEDLTMVGLGFL
jgi:hypothetical protein